MSSYWVEWKTRTQVQQQQQQQTTVQPLAVFAQQSLLWTLSPLRRLTTPSTCWTKEPSPRSITSQQRYRRPRARLRLAHRPPAPVTLALRPPWTPPRYLPPSRATICREYTSSLTVEILLAHQAVCRYHRSMRHHVTSFTLWNVAFYALYRNLHYHFIKASFDQALFLLFCLKWYCVRYTTENSEFYFKMCF